jgi:hypothetical protein
MHTSGSARAICLVWILFPNDPDDRTKQIFRCLLRGRVKCAMLSGIRYNLSNLYEPPILPETQSLFSV